MTSLYYLNPSDVDSDARKINHSSGTYAIQCHVHACTSIDKLLGGVQRMRGAAVINFTRLTVAQNSNSIDKLIRRSTTMS